MEYDGCLEPVVKERLGLGHVGASDQAMRVVLNVVQRDHEPARRKLISGLLLACEFFAASVHVLTLSSTNVCYAYDQNCCSSHDLIGKKSPNLVAYN